jgi:hypothetical protein
LYNKALEITNYSPAGVRHSDAQSDHSIIAPRSSIIRAMHTHPQRRWLLIALVIGLMIVQYGALLRALALPPALAEQISLNRAFEMASSALWLVAAGWMLGGLLARKSGTRARAWVLLLLFIAYRAAHALVFARADDARARLPFALAAGSSALLAVLVIAWRARRKAMTQ